MEGAFDPFFAVAPDFFFPDGCDGFESVDAVAAGVGGFGAVGGGDGDGDGGVADVESSDAVVDGDLGDVPALSGFLGDLAHDGDGHVGVGVVDEVVDVASEVVVADDAEEECDGAGVGSEDEMVEGGGVERLGVIWK